MKTLCDEVSGCVGGTQIVRYFSIVLGAFGVSQSPARIQKGRMPYAPTKSSDPGMTVEGNEVQTQHISRSSIKTESRRDR